jgi:hypothetical protein
MVGILSDFKLIGKLFYIKVQGFGVRGSLLRLSGYAGQAGFSAAAGQKTAGLIEKETLKKRITNPPEADCKYRTRNNEYRSKVFYHYYF